MDFSALEMRVAAALGVRGQVADLIRVDDVLLMDSVRAGAIEHVSMGARVGYTECPACPSGRTDRNNEHWHRPMVVDVAARLALLDSSRTEQLQQDVMDAAFARGEEGGISVINVAAIRKLEFFSNRRPLNLGELMKKGGLDIDAIITSRYDDCYYASATNSVCRREHRAAFKEYLAGLGWTDETARREWRMLARRNVDPRVLLQDRYRTWRKMEKMKSAQRVDRA